MLLDLQSACTGRSRFELHELDIDADETLLREMLELIPVIEVEGDRISTLVADRDAVIRRLDTVRT